MNFERASTYPLTLDFKQQRAHYFVDEERRFRAARSGQVSVMSGTVPTPPPHTHRFLLLRLREVSFLVLAGHMLTGP